MKLLAIGLAVALSLSTCGCQREVASGSFGSPDGTHFALVYLRGCTDADCRETVIKVAPKSRWHYPRTVLRLKGEHQLFFQWQKNQEPWRLEITCYNCAATDVLESGDSFGDVRVLYHQNEAAKQID
jgi:hypothetical protein